MRNCEVADGGQSSWRIDKLPHDAQVRRISWVRGVGRPTLVISVASSYHMPVSVGPFFQSPQTQSAARRRRVQKIESETLYLIFVSLNSTCLRTTGSYLRFTIFSVIVRLFLVVT